MNGALAGVLATVMTAVVVLAVFDRRFFKGSFPWAFELSLYLFIYSGALAMAYTLVKGRHVRVTILWGHLSSAWKRRLDVVAAIAGFLFAAIGAAWGFDDVLTLRERGVIHFGTQWLVPIWVTYLVIPITLTFMALVFLHQIARPRRGQGGPGPQAHR